MSIKFPCYKCKKTGLYKAQVRETVKIPYGIENGETLRMAGSV